MRKAARRFIFRNFVLIVAVFSEVLGLLAAFGSIPGLPLPTAWMLAIAGILSGIGVVIVTIYFMYQYNRRPLNVFQRDEIEGILSEYTPSQELRATFLQKASNDREFAVFWMWRYQKSIMDFAWASRQLENRNGYVLVGQLNAADELARMVHHSVVPPPFNNIGKSLSKEGEALPEGNYMNWESIFVRDNLRFRNAVVLYMASDYRIRVMRTDGSLKVVFSEERASPMLLSANAETPLPTLVQSSDGDGNLSWRWNIQDTSNVQTSA